MSMRSYQLEKYIPDGLTHAGTWDWELPVAEGAGCDEAAEFPRAQQALWRYVEDLQQRFAPGGVYDTRRLPTGEACLEIVCGHPFGGHMLCVCSSPLLAVQLFADAVERYVVQGRTAGTLYWRTHPQLTEHRLPFETWNPDMEKQHKWEEKRYTIRARLLIL